MTAVDVCFRYGSAPDERTMRGIDRLWEVYGIRRVQFDEQERTIRVEYDATRFDDSMVAALLRRAGVDLQEQLALAVS
jgi:hypothetical protein